MGTNWDKQGNYQKYNSDGSAPVMVVGSLAKVEINGVEYPIKFEIDPNGNAVLGIVDSAPRAYDELKDAFNVSTVSQSCKVQLPNYNKTLNVPATTGVDTISIVPPVGELWRITGLNIIVPAPTSATTGTHTIELGNSYMKDIYGKATFNGTIYVRNHQFETPMISVRPTGDTNLISQLLMSGVATAGMPYNLTYYNNTDVDQTNLLTLWARIEAYPINIGW